MLLVWCLWLPPWLSLWPRPVVETLCFVAMCSGQGLRATLQPVSFFPQRGQLTSSAYHHLARFMLVGSSLNVSCPTVERQLERGHVPDVIPRKGALHHCIPAYPLVLLGLLHCCHDSCSLIQIADFANHGHTFPCRPWGKPDTLLWMRDGIGKV